MGMLAEPRVKGRHMRSKWEAVRRTKETLGSQISSEEGDTSMGLGMARKLMESFGWKDGQGLGASNQGLAEPVKLHQNFDSRGVGYTAKRGVEQEHHAAHFQRFESVLAALSAAHSSEDKTAVAAKSDDGSGAAGEVRPKRSRNHLNYHKFSRAKDVSQYSQHDLECVIGAKAHALYSDALKEEELESSDKFTVSELNTTEYFSNRKEAMSIPPPAEYTDVRPSFGAGNMVEKDAEKTEDIVQKNFEERMANSYATCFVTSDSALASQTSAEDANLDDDIGAVAVEEHSKKNKKKKKKSKKSGDESENTCALVQGDGKLDLLEGGPLVAEKENVPTLEMEVESTARGQPEDVQQAEESNLIEVQSEEVSALPKKKKKNRRSRNDLHCNDENKTSSKTDEGGSTGMSASNSAQNMEKENRAVTTSKDPVSTSQVSVGPQSSALWSKYAQYYANSFVKGDTLPGSMESSAQEPKVVADIEQPSKKDRKKKSKRKSDHVSVAEAVEDLVACDHVPEERETDVPDSELGDAAESGSKPDGWRSSKKKRKNKVTDACIDETESEVLKRSQIPEGNAAMDVARDVGAGDPVFKKKKKTRVQELEMCEQIKEQGKISSDTEKCKNADATKCSSDVCETESNSFATSEKKKKKKRKKLQESSAEGKEHFCDEITRESCMVLDDQQSSSHAKGKNKKSQDLAREDGALVEETVPQADVDDTVLAQRKKSTAECTQGTHEEVSQLKKKKKKSSQSLAAVLDELKNCISLEENDSGEKKKNSKKRKRQETDVSEENKAPSIEQDAEKKREKKKQKYTADA